jgi:hypothetical protein
MNVEDAILIEANQILARHWQGMYEELATAVSTVVESEDWEEPTWGLPPTLDRETVMNILTRNANG